MATAAPYTFENWNSEYLQLLHELTENELAQEFTADTTETINTLIESINLLEARVAALEP